MKPVSFRATYWFSCKSTQNIKKMVSFLTKNEKMWFWAHVAIATVGVIQRSNQKFWDFCWKQFFWGYLWKFQGFWSNASGFRVLSRGPSRRVGHLILWRSKCKIPPKYWRNRFQEKSFQILLLDTYRDPQTQNGVNQRDQLPGGVWFCLVLIKIGS